MSDIDTDKPTGKVAPVDASVHSPTDENAKSDSATLLTALTDELRRVELDKGLTAPELVPVLQEFAAIHKANSKLLEAANAKARAKAIIAKHGLNERQMKILELEAQIRQIEQVKGKAAFDLVPVMEELEEALRDADRSLDAMNVAYQRIRIEASNSEYIPSTKPQSPSVSAPRLLNEAARITRPQPQTSSVNGPSLDISNLRSTVATGVGMSTAIFALIIGVPLLLVVPALLPLLMFPLYLAPSLVAIVHGKKNSPSIIALNLLLGWTILGWIVSLVWAMNKD